jgi:hypothetical protein
MRPAQSSKDPESVEHSGAFIALYRSPPDRILVPRVRFPCGFEARLVMDNYSAPNWPKCEQWPAQPVDIMFVSRRRPQAG